MFLTGSLARGKRKYNVRPRTGKVRQPQLEKRAALLCEGALHGKVAAGPNCEGHGNPTRRLILGGMLSGSQGASGGDGYISIVEKARLVAPRKHDDHLNPCDLLIRRTPSLMFSVVPHDGVPIPVLLPTDSQALDIWRRGRDLKTLQPQRL